MNFISYAQNFEDVMLWRALKHVEHGFYVDIGAQDPLVDSVSLAFYEHGWRGVHVEPTQQYSDKLRAARPDETVFQVAIGNQAGMLTFYEFNDTGLSTGDPDIARRHREAGFRCNETVVPVISLDALFEQVGEQDIHWLKLDVEGLEAVVLKSWTDSSILPWVLVIESTRPLTQEESHEEWEQFLLSKGYEYVYYDGLNRFYVSPNHLGLVKAFSTPPNFFDNFVLSASQPFCKLVASKAQQAESLAQQADIKVQELQEHILVLRSSNSWKVTKPLRAAERMMAGGLLVIKQMIAMVGARAKQALRHVVVSSMYYVYKRPVLRNRLKRLVLRFPGLRQRLIGVAMNSSALRSASLSRRQERRARAPELSAMSPRARQIYLDLKTAIENKKKDVA